MVAEGYAQCPYAPVESPTAHHRLLLAFLQSDDSPIGACPDISVMHVHVHACKRAMWHTQSAEKQGVRVQERQAAVQDMAWRQGMEVNRARDEAEEVTEQYWQLHDALREKQQEMDEMEAELEAARSQGVGLQVCCASRFSGASPCPLV